MKGPLEWADRKISQPQIGKPALLPDPEQRPIQRQPHSVVALAHGDADPFTEEAAVDVRSTAEGAAILGVGAVEPEGERDRVPKQEVDVATPQSKPRHVRVWIGPHLDL